jgi:UDP-N-acetylglucosamine--N-acetylmuramyl-(pentapeptide) pyrophosphoryl-undecaprenol N-acetylglucosamine transferase
MTTLLVANDGGQSANCGLVDRFAEVGDRLWVTVPTAQTESMLAGEDACWVGEARTRDWRAVIKNAVRIRELFRSAKFD